MKLTNMKTRLINMKIRLIKLKTRLIKMKAKKMRLMRMKLIKMNRLILTRQAMEPTMTLESWQINKSTMKTRPIRARIILRIHLMIRLR